MSSQFQRFPSSLCIRGWRHRLLLFAGKSSFANARGSLLDASSGVFNPIGVRVSLIVSSRQPHRRTTAMPYRRRRPSLTSIFRGLSLITLTMIASHAPAQTVTTPGGTFPSETYVGVVVNGTTDFLGIRYAAAPVAISVLTHPPLPRPTPARSNSIAVRQGECGRGLPVSQRLCS
jgi:hypothetical protein